MDVKLYLISEGNPDTDLYVFSRYEKDREDRIRSFYRYNDQGGIDYEDYVRVATTGKITHLESAEQVASQDLWIIPYCTDECYLDCPIGDFFGVPYKRRFQGGN